MREVTKVSPEQLAALEGALIKLKRDLVAGRQDSLVKLLPLIFRLRSKPYSLDWSHFMFEPFFKIREVSRRLLLLCGRQVSKSTSQAAAQILRARIQPNYNILTVMPLYEQVRKFSQNYVRPFIAMSPIKEHIIGELTMDSVLQRNIGDGSSLYYGYSSGDPTRLRGTPADELDCDEVQDMDHSDLPIVEQSLAASPFKLVRLTGTPKTFDNTAHLFWEDSSQAHWHIPCICGHLNRCCTDADLLKMVGDGKRNDGSHRTLICTKCGRQANSRAGFYVHDYPERQRSFAGYHVPQVILPMHYESPKDWEIILDVRRDKPQYIYYNEVLGESFDVGAKLLTQDQLVAAATVKPCEPENMPVSEYIQVALGIDWGGRGKEKASDTDDFISNTAMALAGLRGDGSIDIKWLHKVPYEIDQSQETEMAVRVGAMSKANWIALDYGGQGNVQEGQIRAHGWPETRIVPFTYNVLGVTKPIVFYNRALVVGARSSYTLDKPRSLLLLFELIKRGMVRLPDSERYLKDHLRDLLNVYEEAIENPRGSPTRLVKRMSRRSDDILHAINFACMALFHSAQAWPAVTKAFIADEVLPRK
jgi:hypothetical protein